MSDTMGPDGVPTNWEDCPKCKAMRFYPSGRCMQGCDGFSVQKPTKRPSWMEGYKHGYAGNTASQIGCFANDIDLGDFYAGYARGAQEARDDRMLDQWEGEFDDQHR